MTDRIVSYSVGSQILISESVRTEVGEAIRINRQLQVQPKGTEKPLTIYDVGGISGHYHLSLEARSYSFTLLTREIPVLYAVLEGKHSGEAKYAGANLRLSRTAAEMRFLTALDCFTNLKFNLSRVTEELSRKDFYGKVLAWATGQFNNYITVYTTGQSGFMKDYATGIDTAVTLMIAGGGSAITTQGSNANSGTEAYNVFDGIVNSVGLISYSTTNLTFTFTGLDPNLTYEFVFFGNRNDASYTNRLTTTAISDVAYFTQLKHIGRDFSGPSDPSVTIVNGYNTTNGYVARFTNINPGADGDMLITVSSDDGHFYANALMLKAVQADNIPGSFGLAGVSTTQNGADLGVSNLITTANSIVTDAGLVDYAPIGIGVLFGPLSIDLTNAAGGFGIGLSNATYGSFAPVSGLIVSRSASFLDLYVLGTFTPGPGLNPILEPSPTSLRVSINQSGQSLSTAITLNSPPIPIPEPVSLLLLGTGLIGLGARRRR